ncbi:MAG: head GIN domain-containing protein [Usitatibacter sp.]
MNNQRFLLTTAAMLAFALPAAAASQSRDVSGFSGITLSAPIRVDLVLGDRESVVLEGDDKAIAAIETSVENGALHIRMKRDSKVFSWNVNGAEKVRVKITAKKVSALNINGSGDINARELRADALAIGIAGSGDISIGGGKVGDLALQISGSGDLGAGRLEVRRAVVSITGSGDATVWARESLTVSVAGSGDVGYYGDPSLTRSVAGSGEIRRLGAAPA